MHSRVEGPAVNLGYITKELVITTSGDLVLDRRAGSRSDSGLDGEMTFQSAEWENAAPAHRRLNAFESGDGGTT
jgi:hypothetical protein